MQNLDEFVAQPRAPSLTARQPTFRDEQGSQLCAPRYLPLRHDRAGVRHECLEWNVRRATNAGLAEGLGLNFVVASSFFILAP